MDIATIYCSSNINPQYVLHKLTQVMSKIKEDVLRSHLGYVTINLFYHLVKEVNEHELKYD